MVAAGPRLHALHVDGRAAKVVRLAAGQHIGKLVLVAPLMPAGVVRVAESGIRGADDAAALIAPRRIARLVEQRRERKAGIAFAMALRVAATQRRLREDIEGNHDEIEEWNFVDVQIFAAIGEEVTDRSESAGRR